MAHGKSIFDRSAQLVVAATLTLSVLGAPALATAGRPTGPAPEEGASADLKRIADPTGHIGPGGYDWTLVTLLGAGTHTVTVGVEDPGSWEYHPWGPRMAGDGSTQRRRCGSGLAEDRIGYCLQDIADWVDAHPEGEPLLVLVDMRSDGSRDDWSAHEIALLDQYVKSFLGSRLYSFAEQHEQPVDSSDDGPVRTTATRSGRTVRADLRGKVIVGLTGGAPLGQARAMAAAVDVLHRDYGRPPATYLCPGLGSDVAGDHLILPNGLDDAETTRHASVALHRGR